jgi:type IV secretion system protein VirB3
MSAPSTDASGFANGFEIPLHRSLTEPILLGGAPRTVVIANGTLAAAVGLGLQLWLPGPALWIVGHSLAVWDARLDACSSWSCSRDTSSTACCWTYETHGEHAMMHLAEYRTRPALLADWLPWAGLVAPGVVLNMASEATRRRFLGSGTPYTPTPPSAATPASSPKE